MDIGTRLKELRQQRGLTLEQVGTVIGVSKSTILKYEKGETKNMKRAHIQKLATFFGVSPTYLMGMEDLDTPGTIQATTGLIKLYDGIPAGAPAFLDEQVIDYLPTLLPNPNDFAGIRVHGDSMVDRNITDGCTVIIKKQDCAENGQIVACRVNNDEVTLKIFNQQGDIVVLSPANQSKKYNPIIVPVSEFENGSAQILGIAIKIETDII